MKRLFVLLTVLLLLLLLLSACGNKMNENITEEMHKDVEQTISFIEKSLDNNREPTSKEWDTIIEYQVKYDNKLKNNELTDDERLLETLMEGIITELEYQQSLETEKDKLKEKLEKIRVFMKTGDY